MRNPKLFQVSGTPKPASFFHTGSVWCWICTRARSLLLLMFLANMVVNCGYVTVTCGKLEVEEP